MNIEVLGGFKGTLVKMHEVFRYRGKTIIFLEVYYFDKGLDSPPSAYHGDPPVNRRRN